MAPRHDNTGAGPSRAAFRAHPIHPMLVPLPIGFLVATLLADIGFALTGDAMWSRGALWLLGAGLVTAAIAAPFGVVDFVSLPKARRHIVGWFHAIGNLSAVAVAAVNMAIRWDDLATALPAGLLLSLVTVLILAATGWAGGELVYRHRVGVIPKEEPTWHDPSQP